MLSSATQRIACTAIMGRIVMGRIGKDGHSFIGEKRDVTSDVLKAVIDKAAYHGGSFEIEGGGEKWLVTVSQAPQPAPAQQLPDPLGCRACTHPDCGRFDGPRSVECAAMAFNSCARPERADVVEVVKRNAARYAYLRSRPLDTIQQGGVFAGRVPHNVVLNGDDLDAAVDAALQAQSKEGGAAC